jgi:hypothetical protein
MNSRLRNFASAGTLALFALLALASGGKKDGGTVGTTTTTSADGKKPVGSCDLTLGIGTCEDHYKNGFFTELSKNACADLAKINGDKGWSTTAPCAQTDIVGACTASEGDGETEYFYAPMHTQKTAEANCKGKLSKHVFKSMGTPADPASARVSCTKPGADTCAQWNASSTEGWEAIRTMCKIQFEKPEIANGKACNTDGAYARCDRPDGTVDVFYKKSSASFDKLLCKERPGQIAGTWVDLGKAGGAKPAAKAAGKAGTPGGAAKAKK